MASTKFQFDVQKAKRFQAVLGHAVLKETVDRHMGKASELNGKAGEALVRKALRSGKYAPNAALTIAIKSSSKPLVDTGSGVFQAITSTRIDANTVFIGILRVADEYNLALALHEGASVPVTPKMRGLFFALWQASEGQIPAANLEGAASTLWERMPGGWMPLKQSTTVITIPPRRFIDDVLAKQEFKALCHRNWSKAAAAAYKELAARCK